MIKVSPAAEDIAVHVLPDQLNRVNLGEITYMSPYTIPPLDTSLSISGAAADANAVGEAVADLRSALSSAVDETVIDRVIENTYTRSNFRSGLITPNGTIYESTTGSGYVEQPLSVEPGEIVTAQKYYLNGQGQIAGLASIAFRECVYFADDTFTFTNRGFTSAADSFSVPSDIHFVQPTFSGIMSGTYTHVIIRRTKENGQVVYELRGDIADVVDSEKVHALIDGTFSMKDLRNGYAVALPKTFFRQTVGLPESWYKKSMVTPPSELVYVSGGYSTTKDEVKCVSFPNISASHGTNGYVWYAFDSAFNLLHSFDNGTGYGGARSIVNENLSSCSCLIIGDSTVDSDKMTGTMLEYFSSKNLSLTLLGTLGSQADPLNKNEGRAGWNTNDYMTNSTRNGYTNPFYNPDSSGFDFSYYMSRQGYSGVDFVVIQLGINDLYPTTPLNSGEPDYETIFGHIRTMIDSIHAYNSAIKVIVNLPTTPNSDPSQHRIPEFLYRHYVIQYNAYALGELIKHYSTSRVRPSYCHLILDPESDIRDNVHPTDAGYYKMAMEVINQINCWQNGV
jgi:hypothetical protein